MPRLPNLSGKKLMQILLSAGFVLKRKSSSHFIVEHSDGRVTTIPIHSNKDLPKGTLGGILRDIAITGDNLRDLMR